MAMFSKAFVTGSTGLLGNNLVHALTERGVLDSPSRVIAGTVMTGPAAS